MKENTSNSSKEDEDDDTSSTLYQSAYTKKGKDTLSKNVVYVKMSLLILSIP